MQTARPDPQVFLGAPKPNWLALLDRNLFVSYGSLRSVFRDRTKGWRRRPRRPNIPIPQRPCKLDGRGFWELFQYGTWTIGAVEYAEDTAEFHAAVGTKLQAALPQDWMCEPFMLAKTKKTVREHQDLTVQSFLRLRELAPAVPWGAVLQGYTTDEYLQCIELYRSAGVQLETLPSVAVGSMCKRQRTVEAAAIAKAIRAALGPTAWIHLLGYKGDGIPQIRGVVDSTDSMAWSLAARLRHYIHPGCKHGKLEARTKLLNGVLAYGNCASCMRWACFEHDNWIALAEGRVPLPPPGVQWRPR